MLLVLTPLADICQYRGGSDDGVAFTNLPKINIIDANAFRGSVDDGFALTNLPKTIISDANNIRANDVGVRGCRTAP